MVRLGIIGTGNMANTHAENFSAMKGVRLAACADIDASRARAFAARWNIPKWYGDYRVLLAAESLDAVSIVTADEAHAPVTLAAIARGVAVLCEKPLATSGGDARKMRDAARARGVVTHVNFSYRNAPCVQAAAALVRDGGIGRVLHVESSYLQGWLLHDTWGDWRTTDAFTWRLSKRHGSTGTLGDIGCHIYDLTALLCGEITEVNCRLATFDKGITGNRVGPYVLDANDSFVSTLKLAGGAVGVVHATRWAAGHVNSLSVRLFGDRGAVEVDLDRSVMTYRLARSKKPMRLASWKDVTGAKTPTQYQRFIAAVQSGVSDESDFVNGARIQACIDASLLSDKRRRPVSVTA